MKRVKNILLLIACCIAFVPMQAQVNIVKAEYFIDADPGFGKAINIPVTAAANIADRAVAIPITAVPDGFHNLFLRTADANGVWSVTNKLSFYKINSNAVLLPNIVKAEYFIDADPGFGKAINIPVTAAANIADRSFIIPLTAVADGFHNLFVRSLDANGVWSVSNKLSFYKTNTNSLETPDIVAAEYFIDTDPGFGNASAIPVSAGDIITDRSFTIPLNNVANGFHNIFIRSKNANGVWSVTNKQAFYKVAETAGTLSKIVKAEYFIDTDPGFGNAVNVPLTAAANIANRSVEVSLTGITGGSHRFYLRTMDENNVWSITNTDTFFISDVVIPEVTIGAIAATVCAGTTLEVPYTVNTAFGAGNIFTVQLSNVAGSFDAPVTIGTSTASASGTINCTIPAGTAAGTAYRIRILSTSPITTSKISADPISIKRRPEVAYNINGQAQTCQLQQAYNVSLTEADATYSWQLSGGGILSANNIAAGVLWTDKGAFTLTVTATNTCGNGNPVQLNVNVFASAPLLTPSVTLAGRTLTATLAPAGQDITGYQWYKDGALISGQVNQSYTVPNTETGSYTVAYTNACGVGVPSAPVVISIVRNSQSISFTPVAPKVFGDAPFEVSATATSGLPVVYSIISGPGTIDGNTITITGAGVIVVKAVQPGNDQFSDAEATLNITVQKAPATLALSNLEYIFDGTAKKATVVTTPLGLNHSVSYNGSFTLPVNAGSYNVSAVITSPNYQGSKDSILVITKASQLITLPAIPDKNFNDAPFTVQAISTSGLPVTVSIVTVPASGVATLSGNTITVVGGGTVTVTATQAGNSNYHAAAAVQTSFMVIPPAAKDVGVLSLVQPAGGCGLGAEADITVRISNTGTQAVSGIPVSWQIDGGEVITETIVSSIAAGAQLDYTFATKASFPFAGETYTVKIFTALSGDERLSNDTLTQSVVRYNAPLPTGVTKDTAICNGASVTLRAFGGSTYQWAGGPATASFIVSPNTTTTYQVTITDINGCNTTQHAVTVTVNLLPAINAGPDQSMLKGSSVTLSGTGGGVLKWSTGSTNPVIIVSPEVTTTYTLTATNDKGCKATDDVVVTVNFSALNVTPGLYDFGNVVFDSTAFGTIVVKNTGTVTETINGIDGVEAPFTASFSVPFALPPGISVNIPIRFTPPATLVYQNKFVLATSAGNFNITLLGKGVDPAPAWVAQPAYYDFGKVDNGSFVTKNIAVKNTGNIPIRITTISSSNPRFTANTAGVLDIPVGGTVSVQVRFNPVAVTTYSGVITLRTATTGLAVLRLLVDGTGFINGNPPVLQFVSVNTKGDSTGVMPEVSPPGMFTYSVLYSHPDNVAPMPGWPKVGIDRTNDGDFIDNAEGLFTMTQAGNTSNWQEGEVYIFTTSLTPSEMYGYTFFAKDARGNDTETKYRAGPFVTRDILDLHIFADDIKFSKPNPAVNEIFTVTATVHNDSYYSAADVEVRFYYKDTIYLFSDTIPFIDAKSTVSVTRELSFAPDGFYPIKVWIDSANTLGEGNILNNYASRPVIIGIFTVPGTIDQKVFAAPVTCSRGVVNFSGRANYRGLNLEGTPPVEGATVTLKVYIGNDPFEFNINTDIKGNWYYTFDLCRLLGEGADCEGPPCGVPYRYSVETTDYTLTSPLFESTYITPCVPCAPDGEVNYITNIEGCIIQNRPYKFDVSIAVFSVSVDGKRICAPTIFKDTLEIYQNGQLQFVHTLDSIQTCTGITFSNLFGGLDAGKHNMSFIHSYYTGGGERIEDRRNISFEVLPETTDLTLKGIFKTGLKSFVFTDNNTTCGIPAGPHWVYLYDSLPGYTEKILIDSFFVENVNPNSFITLSYNNPDWEVGRHYLTIITDVHNNIEELNEKNNILKAEFYVIEPDIVVPAINGKLRVSNTNIRPGTLVNFTSRIVNEGSPIKDPFRVQFKVDGIPLGNKQNVPSLNTNETALILSAPYTAPNDPCPREVTIKADSDDEIPEFQEKNNFDTMYVGVNIRAGRDCGDAINIGSGFRSPEDPDCTPYVVPAGVLSFFETTVRNDGTRDTRDEEITKVQFKYLGQVLGDATVPKLKVGARSEVGVFYKFDAPGQYIINAFADYTKEICEINEKDNIGNIHIEVRSTMGDLQILSQHIAPSNLNPDPGQNISVVASILNIGDAPVGPTKVRFWVDNEQLGADIPIDTLYPGQDTTVMATALYASNIVGPKIIKVRADATGMQVERTKGNNEATRAIIVGGAPDFAHSQNEAITLVPPVFAIGDSISIRNYIRNYGGDGGTAWMRFYYRSASTGEKILIDSVRFTMNDNDSFRIQLKWKVAETAGMIITEIDHSVPPEFNTLNNIDSLPFGTAVPVTLVAFTGRVQQQLSVLQWQSAEEINVAHYALQRSLNGRDFTNIALLPATNTLAGSRYAYTDSAFAQLPAGNVYYRLRMVDIGGAYKYSPVVVLRKARPSDVAELYPNPVQQQLQLRIDAAVSSSYNIRVFDGAGRLILLKNSSVNTGINTISLDVSSLAQGLYMIVLHNNRGNSEQLKFVKE